MPYFFVNLNENINQRSRQKRTSLTTPIRWLRIQEFGKTSVKAFCEKSIGHTHGIYRILYIILLFVNCMLHGLYIITLRVSVCIYVHMYIFFSQTTSCQIFTSPLANITYNNRHVRFEKYEQKKNIKQLNATSSRKSPLVLSVCLCSAFPQCPSGTLLSAAAVTLPCKEPASCHSSPTACKFLAAGTMWNLFSHTATLHKIAAKHISESISWRIGMRREHRKKVQSSCTREMWAGLPQNACLGAQGSSNNSTSEDFYP